MARPPGLAGVGIPVDLGLLASALDSARYLLRKSRAEAAADRRFAEAVYRAAIADRIMDNVTFRDPAAPVIELDAWSRHNDDN